MGIPHSCDSLLSNWVTNVPFNKDCSWGWANNWEHEISEFSDSLISSISYLEHCLWGSFWSKEWARSSEGWPGFSYESWASRHEDCGCNQISTSWEINNLGVSTLSDCLLNSSSIVSLSISSSSEGFHWDEFRNLVEFILRLRSFEELSSAWVQEVWWFYWLCQGLLSECSSSTLVLIDLTLSPRFNSLGCACRARKKSLSVGSHNSDWDIAQFDIVQNKSATSVRLRCSSSDCLNSKRSVSEWRVEYNSTSYLLGLWSSWTDVQTDFAVFDLETLESPSPVPSQIHSSDCIVNLDVSWGELLVSNPHAELSSVEGKVVHESTGSVFHENTLVVVAFCCGHFEHNVSERSSLSNLPMDTSGTSSDSGQIDFEVSDLSVEVVLVSPPVVSSSCVWVWVNDCHSCERGSGCKSRDIVCISDKLSVVVLNNGRGNKVIACREVNKSWLDCGRVATLSASDVSTNCSINGSCVVSHTITSGSVFFYISENPVRAWVVIKSSHAFVGNGLNPHRVCTS